MNPLQNHQLFLERAPLEVWFRILRYVVAEGGLEGFAYASKEAYGIAEGLKDHLLKARRTAFERFVSPAEEETASHSVAFPSEWNLNMACFASKGEDGTIYSKDQFIAEGGRFYACSPIIDSVPRMFKPQEYFGLAIDFNLFAIRAIIPFEGGICVIADRCISFQRSGQDRFQILANDYKDFVEERDWEGSDYVSLFTRDAGCEGAMENVLRTRPKESEWEVLAYASFGKKIFFSQYKKSSQPEFYEIDFSVSVAPPKIVPSRGLQEIFNSTISTRWHRMCAFDNYLYIITSDRIIELESKGETFIPFKLYKIECGHYPTYRINQKWFTYLSGNALFVHNRKTDFSSSMVIPTFRMTPNFHLQGDFAYVYHEQILYIVDLENETIYEYFFDKDHHILFVEFHLEERAYDAQLTLQLTLQVHFTKPSSEYVYKEYKSLDLRQITEGESKGEKKIEFIDKSTKDRKSTIGKILIVSGVILAFLTAITLTVLLNTHPGSVVATGPIFTLTVPALGVLASGGPLALLIVSLGLYLSCYKNKSLIDA